MESKKEITYVPYHLHTMHSNGVTNIDSVTRYQDYIQVAKDCGIKAMAFSEHGCIFEWYFKKLEIEKAGLKYIHAVEAYVTEDGPDDWVYHAKVSKKYDDKPKQEEFQRIFERDGKFYAYYENGFGPVEVTKSSIKKELRKTRDNYHVVLIARNYEGVKEINSLMSAAWNRSSNHFHYYPRIYMEDLMNTSDNVLITTACLGGILGKGTPTAKEKFINFLTNNKHRCWLEIQHHDYGKQIKYNQSLYKLSEETGIPLIVGTDTHSLNEEHAAARIVLQNAKNIKFPDEEYFDLVFKTPDELIKAYEKQNSLPMDVVLAAIEETNKMADLVENFVVDTSPKYPLPAGLEGDSYDVFRERIYKGAESRGLTEKSNWDEYKNRIEEEIKVYQHNNAINFMLMEEDYKRNLREKDVYCGPSRGSCSGSICAYCLGITDVDSLKYKLNFQRFMSSERVSLADIDSDWYRNDREKVKDYLYEKYPNCCCEIVTFNTIALKGAIDDVSRALYKDTSDSKSEYMKIAAECKRLADISEEKARRRYPDIFKWVDILNGCIVSVGNHPAATVVSPFPVHDVYGTFSTDTSKYPICVLKMKEVDKLNAVKLDILGLDNVGLIYQTCQLVGIPFLTPDKTDFDIQEVWDSIKEDTIGIFQWESESATEYLKELFSDETVGKIKRADKNFNYLNLFSMGNGAIRPAGESYRNQLAKGKFKTYGCKPLDDFMKPYLGYMIYQEQIMNFLNKFCGYTMGEADIVRRGFAKKTGTEEFIPRIKSGFVETMTTQYDIPKEQAEKIIVDFIRVIEDASDYLFSENHALPYSMIGYMCAYLRWKYPVQFITSALNIFGDDQQKQNKIVEFAKKKNISIKNIQFRKSKAECFFDKQDVYKGVCSVNGVGKAAADELYALKDMKFTNFMDLAIYIRENCPFVHTDMLEKLCSLSFFSEFGDANMLLEILRVAKKLHKKKTLKVDGSTLLNAGLLDVDTYMNIANDYIIKAGKKDLKVDMNGFLIAIAPLLPYKPQTPTEIVKAQFDYLGYIDYINPEMKGMGFVTFDDTKYQPRLKIYSIRNGKTRDVRIKKDLYKENPIVKGDMVVIGRTEKVPKNIKDETGRWIKSATEKDLFLRSYKKIDVLGEE